MTKKELAKAIAQAAGVTQGQALDIVQQVFDEIVQTLVQEGRIELRNFGIFEVHRRQAWQARNPRTGEQVLVPERAVIRFTPGRQLRLRVRQLATLPDRNQQVCPSLERRAIG